MVTDLRHLIVTSAALYGDKPRYIFKDKKTRKDVSFSFNDFLREMNGAGTAFSALDLMGKTIAVIGDTHPLYVVTYFAVVNGNGIIVPLDKEINDDELVNFLIRSHAEAVVYTESQNARMAAIADRVDGIRYFIPITPADSDEGRDRVLSWEALQKMGEEELAKGNRTYLDLTLDLEKPCALLFTSGTTGTGGAVCVVHS